VTAGLLALWGVWTLRESVAVGLAALGYAAAWLVHCRMVLRGG
jgi:hypothetical protein